MIARRVSVCLSILLLIGMFFYLQFFWSIGGSGDFVFGEMFINLLLALPFFGFPFIVAIILSFCVEKPASQWTITAGSFLYVVLFSMLGIGPCQLTALNIGFFALPVLLPLWIFVLIADRRFGLLRDKDAIEKLVREVFAGHPDSVATFKAGRKASADFLVGKVIQRSEGKADPKMVSAMVGKALE